MELQNCARIFSTKHFGFPKCFKFLVQLLLNTFPSSSSTLELSRQFFVMYGNDQAMQPMIRSFLKQIIERTMKELQSTGNPSDFADLVAAFFQVKICTWKKNSLSWVFMFMIITFIYGMFRKSSFSGLISNFEEIS